MTEKIEWPSGKEFAFTILDDPDLDTVENVAAIYTFLCDLGFRTTKAVWPIKGNGKPKVGGATCEDDQYLKWVLELQKQGFEIALHNVTYHTSSREQTVRGLDTFRQIFGHDPSSMSNHSGCHESIYWGRERLSGKKKAIYDLLNLQLNGKRRQFQGHLVESPLFWGDLCRERIKYVRNFVLGDINTLKACPAMPYHDPLRPYVNYWFAGSEGPRVESFVAMTSEANQDRLIEEGGACIMYTHLASGFLEKGTINKRFKFLMERLSRMNGWFVPASTLFDHILRARGSHTITQEERNNLETRWLWHKLFHTGGRS